MILIHLVEGGDGSGNHGHKGRQGQVGGSLKRIGSIGELLSQEELGGDIWHGTPLENLDSILKDGLLVHHGGFRVTNEDSGLIYMTKNLGLSENVAAIASLVHDEGKFALLKIDPKKLDSEDILYQDPDSESVGIVTKNDVPREALELFEISQIDSRFIKIYRKISKEKEELKRNTTREWEWANYRFYDAMSEYQAKYGYRQKWYHTVKFGRDYVPEVKESEGSQLYAFVIGDGVDKLLDFLKKGN